MTWLALLTAVSLSLAATGLGYLLGGLWARKGVGHGEH